NQRDAACSNCYKRFATSAADAATIDQRASDIVAFNPHFIIPFVDVDWGTQLLPKLEEKYAGLAPSIRPTYLHPILKLEETGYPSLPVASADVRKRITGIRVVRDNTYEVFQNKFRDAFRPASAPDKLGPAPNAGAGRAFETSLLVLFATYAALLDNANARPEDVVAALKVVADSSAPTRITLNDITPGIQRLNAKQHINLDGLFSSFEFDYQAYSTIPTWTTWCIDATGQYVSGTRIFQN